MYRYFRDFDRIARVFAGLALAVLLVVPHVCAQSEEELSLLKLYYRDKDLVFTPTRVLQPVSRTAENITIITAEEIEKMNAHTLTDVLNAVPGVQVQVRGGPGIGSSVNVQGSEMRHVLILMDGVKLNTLAENVADMASIPVQMIERIEVLKGPGSSTWGSSLGGVINIITKSPDEAGAFGGSASASLGERRTGDYRAEATGTIVGRLGYYFYGGYLTSGGFAPQTSVYEKNAYSKFSWRLPKGNVTWTGGYISSSRGDGRIPEWDQSYGMAVENMFTTLSFNHRPTGYLDLDASLRLAKNRLRSMTETISSGVSQWLPYDDHTIGGSAKVSYKHGAHSIVVGADCDDGQTGGEWVAGKNSLRTLAFFSNDAMTLGKLTIIPGIRYDHTNTNGGFVSPSLGIAYRFGETTTLRAYGARGFNIPPLSSLYSTTPGFVPNPDLDVEKVNSFQIGVESFVLKYVWFKTTLFRHDVSDAITPVVPLGASYLTVVNTDRQRRQGLEIEIKTKPIRHFALAGGAAYLDLKNRTTSEPLPNSPRYTYDIGLEYNNDQILFALLKGHYVRFASTALGFRSKDSAFVWDVHVSKTIFRNKTTSTQLFFSVHNLFNADQYLIAQWPNPSRWAEAGVRVRF